MNRVRSWLNLAWYLWKRNNWIVDPRRLFVAAADVSIDRPIFLLGNQGGGLTLVSRMLRRHPRVVNVTGDHEYWAGADELQKVMLPRLPDSLRLGGRVFRDGIEHPVFTPPRSWSYGTDDLIGEYRCTRGDADGEAARALRKIIGESLAIHGGNGGSRFVDKSQVYTVKTSFVDALLEGCSPHFVLVTRNPYAACYRAALGKAADMKRYADRLSLAERVGYCAEHWHNTVTAALEDGDEVEHFTWFRFEDFLREPRRMVSRLCEFVGLSFREEMVPGPDDDIPFGTRFPSRWYPLRPDVNEKYLARLPREFADVISDRCGSLASRFGYSTEDG